MKDLIFGFLSEVVQMDMTNPHDIPFAMPLMMACMVGGLIGFAIVSSIKDEQREDRKDRMEIHNDQFLRPLEKK